MDHFPGNSQNSKKTDSAEPEVEEIKVERPTKIIVGKVVQRKKPLGSRLMQTFFGSENSVWSYILHDVLIPAAKDTVADMITQGAEKALFGDARSTSRRTGSRPGGSSGYVSYNRFSSSSARRDEPRTISRRARATHDFEEIILDSRAEAYAVIDQMGELASKYQQVTVSDLYDLVGIPTTFADEKWGWRDIRGVGPTRVTGGYLLDLPKPEPLD